MDFLNKITNRSPFKLPKRTISLLVCAIPVAYILLFILRIAFYPDHNLWDFEKDYFWAKAFVQGFNPYDVQTVKALADRPYVPPFLYMPLSLIFFVPFTLFSCANAEIFALFFYAVMLFATFIAFSRRMISENDFAALYFFFALLAFNGAINKSIQTGNVSSLESALIFLSFLFWLKRSHALFLCCIFMASIFKLTPLFFLLIIFFDKKPPWKSTIIATTIFLIVLAISFLAMPVSMTQWLPFAHANMGLCDETATGFNNPSMLCLLTTAMDLCYCSAVPEPLVLLLYVIWIGVILFFTVRAGIFLGRKGDDAAKADAVALILLCYALVLPRFRDYSWVIVIPAAFRVLMAREHAKTIGPLLLLCLLPQRQDTLPGLANIFKLAMGYSPIIVASGAWLLLVMGVKKSSTTKSPVPQ